MADIYLFVRISASEMLKSLILKSRCSWNNWNAITFCLVTFHFYNEATEREALLRSTEGYVEFLPYI